MLRYVGLLWDPADGDACGRADVLGQRLMSRSKKWTLVLSDPGLSLWVFESPFECYAAHRLGDSGGTVLGVLFDRNDPRRRSTSCARFFDDEEAGAIVRSRGRRLIERYWGRYVAFLRDACTPSIRILRDPIGDIPCYHARTPSVDVYFSSLSDLLQLEAVRLTVDWEHLGTRVVTGNAWADESALNEIECVHPGECVEHDGMRISREYYWHPFVAARAPQLEQLNAAAAELRSTTKMCVDAWASLHANAVHILSGGLDSSIVLSCLADTAAGSRISCLNFRTRDPDSDERPYARLAAGRAGRGLVEVERAPSVALERIFECNPTVGPLSLVMRGLEVQPLIAQFAQARNATAVYSGDGGDLVFFRGWPELAVIDYAFCRGLRPELMSLILGAALPAQLSVWRLLSNAVRYVIFRRPWDIRDLVFEHYRLITDDVVANVRRKLDFLNPWHLPVQDVPPGKRLHAFSVTRPCLFRDPLSSGADLDFINPLVCQPVVELCLRIPTYLHAAGGRDRAVARAAFATDLPCAIAMRTWKGAADRHLQDILSANLDLVRELLLDGGLVKAGILDRQRLENALSRASVRSRSHATEVFGYFCTEAWLRRWSGAVS